MRQRRAVGDQAAGAVTAAGRVDADMRAARHEQHARPVATRLAAVAHRFGQFLVQRQHVGLVFTELDDNERAADAFSKAIKLNPELHAAYNNLGYVYYKQGSYDRAVEMYNESLSRSANNSSAYTNLGNAHFKLGNKEDARRAWQRAIELDPSNEKAKRSLKSLDS